MSSCETCVENEFSVLGSTTCLKCPEGTFSGAESDSCTTCTFWYRLPMLEYGHCEQPFVAYAVALIGFLLLLITIYRCYKSYKLKKEQIKKMKTLLKARHDDMELMSSAWLIQWNELDLKQQLASGGFGEVSALHHVPPCTISLDHPLLSHPPHHLGHHDQCLSFQHPRLFGHHDHHSQEPRPTCWWTFLKSGGDPVYDHHDHKVTIDQVASFFTTFTK